MSGGDLQMFWVFIAAIVMVLVAGFYCIIATRNMIRALIGIEILMKAVTLLFILVGHVTGQEALVQAIVITIIVIEVVVVVVAGGVILSIYKHEETLDVRNLRRLKG